MTRLQFKTILNFAVLLLVSFASETVKAQNVADLKNETGVFKYKKLNCQVNFGEKKITGTFYLENFIIQNDVATVKQSPNIEISINVKSNINNTEFVSVVGSSSGIQINASGNLSKTPGVLNLTATMGEQTGSGTCSIEL